MNSFFFMFLRDVQLAGFNIRDTVFVILVTTFCIENITKDPHLPNCDVKLFKTEINVSNNYVESYTLMVMSLL